MLCTKHQHRQGDLENIAVWNCSRRTENVRITHACIATCSSPHKRSAEAPCVRGSAATPHLCVATHFSWGVPPTAWLSWLGFWGGLGFCCSGGRPPGPPWPWVAGWGCWVVGRALCCCEPPCDCCLGGWLGLSCCWPAAFWPGALCCCWDTDCCLWLWGKPWPEDGLWPWGAPWLGGRVCAAPWLALAAPLSPAAVAAVCWGCAGGWPWGCGRCWDGGGCWGPPREEKELSLSITYQGGKNHFVTGCYPEVKGAAESEVL